MPADTTALLTAKLVEWNRQKGYGFLQLGQERVFLHRHDFAEIHCAPVVGEIIKFTMGRDARGRSCATNAVQASKRGEIGVVSVLVLLGLLVLPMIALRRGGVNFWWVGGYAAVVNVITYWMYSLDKRRARTGEWRVAEARLHLVELLGGWPGAWLAQRWLRHKCSKGSYQFVFWLIVLIYQFAALDSFQNWQFSRAALRQIESASEHRR